MAARREVYEAGRADERSEVVAWLRSSVVMPNDHQLVLADRIERGEHAEAVVLGVEVPG